MTSHDPLATFVIVASVLALVLVGTFLYLRLLKSGFFRGWRTTREEERIGEDHAYTAMVTSQAISRELRDKGFRSPQASALIEEARQAYFEGNVDEAESLSGEARTILLGALRKDRQEGAAPFEEEVPESKPLLGKEFPKHYLEAKFLLGLTEGRVKRTKKSSKKGQRVRKLWEQAQTAFEKEGYSKALSLALQCRRLLDGMAPKKKPPQPRCQECGAAYTKGEEFCGKCGAALKASGRCQECGTPLVRGDSFCRKCGSAAKPPVPTP